MSKTRLRKIYGYCVLLGGTAFMVNGIAKLEPPDRWIPSILFGAFLVLLALPLVIFGAAVRPGESSLKVSQYDEVDIGYEEVRGCYRYMFPPFWLVVITTTRRFPLCILIERDGTPGSRDTLSAKVRSRMRV